MKWARSIHRISSQSNPDGFEPNWIAKLHAYSVNFDWAGLRRVSFPVFCHLVEYDFPIMLLCLYFWQGTWIICPAYCFLVLILPCFLQELIWFISWLKRKTCKSKLTHNSTLSCIRVRTFMKLFFFIYTKMTFLIVNPSERWFIKLTLHFLLTTQLTSPINNQFN